MDDLLKAQEALEHIPASDRELWLKMAMALKSEFGEAGYDAWLDWSQQDDSFNPKDAASVWRSVKVGTIGIGTLFHEAKSYGWECKGGYIAPDPLVLAQRKEAQRLALAKQQEADKQARLLAQQQANSRWQTAAPANPNHPYLQTKIVLPYGIKQENNLLLIPMLYGGELVNLQFISPKGGKWSIKGGQAKNTYCVIGDVKQLSHGFYVCEGWATGASLHEFTCKPVLVAFSEGNLLGVALAARGRFPHAQIVIGADNDLNHPSGQNIGLVKAQEAALAVQGQVQLPPDDFNDWNDYATAFKYSQLAKGVSHA